MTVVKWKSLLSELKRKEGVVMNIAPIARWGQAAVFEKAANGIVEIHAHLEAVEMEVLEQVVTSRLHSRLSTVYDRTLNLRTLHADDDSTGF